MLKNWIIVWDRKHACRPYKSWDVDISGAQSARFTFREKEIKYEVLKLQMEKNIRNNRTKSVFFFLFCRIILLITNREFSHCSCVYNSVNFPKILHIPFVFQTYTNKLEIKKNFSFRMCNTFDLQNISNILQQNEENQEPSRFKDATAVQ